MRKKYLIIIIFNLVLILLFQAAIYADEYSIFGGLKRDMTLKKGVYYYEEMCFMSGKPVLLKGTVTIPNTPTGQEYKISVKYELKNIEEGIELGRTATYNVTNNSKNEMGQVITNYTIPEGALKETVKLKDKTYELTSFQFNNARITDRMPAISFSSSNIYFKKVFHTNGALSDKGSRITIIGESESDLAYSNYWSDSSSRIMRMSIEYDELPVNEIKKSIGPEDTLSQNANANSWKGSVVYKFSTKTASSFENVQNDVQTISFKNGLLKNENTEDLLVYSYDMPLLNQTKKEEKTGEIPGEPGPLPKSDRRNKGEGKLNSYVYQKSSRLPVPKFKDIGAHWAEKDIFQLASIEAFELGSAFFPDIYITRGQFARAMVNSVGHVNYEDEATLKQELIKSQRPGAKPLPFEDVPRDDSYFVYINKAFEDGIMLGEGNEQFLPNRPLTRAEAITIMMRSIGVVDIAPILPFSTRFSDDKQIPDWAKPSIYMADQIGIVKGYADGFCMPLKHVTRAEAAAMLSRLIEHLRSEITYDYREKLLDSR